MSADVWRKVALLVNRATAHDHTDDPALLAASAQEKSVAALAACRLISESGLLNGPPPPRGDVASEMNMRVDWRSVVLRTLKTRYDGECRCGTKFCIGDTMGWERGYRPVIASHINCVAELKVQIFRVRAGKND